MSEKPREFWLGYDKSEMVRPRVSEKPLTLDDHGETGFVLEEIHVIEYSAFEAIKLSYETMQDLNSRLVKERPKRFPIQSQRGAKPHPLSVPWSIAELAYSVYSSRYGRDQSLERLAERGGFGPDEMDMFLPDWRERCDENEKLRSMLKIAEEALGIYEDRSKWQVSEPMKSLGWDPGVFARVALTRIGEIKGGGA